MIKYAINNNGSISIYCGNIAPAGSIVINDEQYEGIMTKRLTLSGGNIVSTNKVDEAEIQKKYQESLSLIEEAKTKTGLNGTSVKKAEELIDALYADVDTVERDVDATKKILKKLLPFILRST